MEIFREFVDIFDEKRRLEERLQIEKISKLLKQQKEGRIRYRKTENGILQTIKSSSELRGLGSTPLFLNIFIDDIKVEYHHVNPMIVVPIPRNFHRNARQNHIDECNKWIKDYYLIDIEKLFNDDSVVLYQTHEKIKKELMKQTFKQFIERKSVS